MKVFVSHASADKDLVSLFIDRVIVAGSGVKLEDIMYTSRGDTGVVNGEDIPETIKKGILECGLFFMMVSDNYRNSEVCLNEMGASWMRSDLVRKIIVLPNTGFDKIGWLLSLKKGTKIDDSEGLDMIHDEVVHLAGASIKTATWNRIKAEFLAGLTKTEKGSPNAGSAGSVATPPSGDESEMDLLEKHEHFGTNKDAYLFVIRTLTDATEHYNGVIVAMTRKLNHLQDNPQPFSASQVRGIFQGGTAETIRLSEVYEQQSPLLKEHFDQTIKYAILLRDSNLDAEAKKNDREQCQVLIDSMINTRDKIQSFRNELEKSSNIDKGFFKATERLKKALDGVLEVFAFCVTRVEQYRVL